MTFNEDSRVKLPSVIHLQRLGYEYLSLTNAVYNRENNIFTDIFKQSISRINPDMEEADISHLLAEIGFFLDNEDLGNSFYEKLIEQSGTKIIDFTNFENNSFHVVTELTYQNGDEEFRPDITILINGIPLAFIEVKKPNNQDGMLAEITRSSARFSNKKLRKFANI
ncbi:MAG: type I restriction endonuclease, partial [Dolichospermum sp.]